MFSDGELERFHELPRLPAQLERQGILSPQQREIVIERLVALDADEVDIERLKWVVLMVLSSQPGQEQACARMEDLLFDDRTHSPELMADNLVIVESPAKAKTIKKYLGKDFEVLASYGHVRDLVPKEGAVDPDNGFAMQYQVAREEREPRRRHLAGAEESQGAVPRDRPGSRRRSDLLAPARNPEGARRARRQEHASRGVLRDHASSAVRAAVAEPRDLSLDLVNAQQARRALDYLVGFNLSPLLWKKVRRGLSAGRVQSPALRMICEREEEIAAFNAAGILDARWPKASTARRRFPLKLVEYRGHEGRAVQLHQRERGARSRADASKRCARRGRSGDALGTLRVIAIDRKQRRRNPAPPFTTSTLQQEAARKLGFNARRTMRLAQQLYEGVDIGEGAVGLITYMRTDSVNPRGRSRARDPRSRRRAYTARREVAEEPRVYKTKSQERAGSARGDPADVRGHRAGGHRGQDSIPTSQAVFAHLEARGRHRR